MIDAAGTTAYTYHLNRRLQSENGPWANDTVTYGYHTQSPFLRTSLTLQQPAGSWTQSYAYDDARRLDTLTSPAGQFAYDYHLAGRKVENLFLPTGGRIANDYTTDPLARLTGTWLLNSAQQTLNVHGYEHNLRNDITRHTRTDASFVDYDYDDLGQLTDAVGSGSSGSPVRSRRRFGVRRWSGADSPLFERVRRWCAG
jgi:YD repeat-containing protein